MEKEIWKDIPNYEGLYQISNLGRLKSLPKLIKMSNRVLQTNEIILSSSCCNSVGYPVTTLTKNKIKKMFSIHQLVAIAFLNHTPCKFKLIIDHINGIKTDNAVSNLRIVTIRENSTICYRKNTPNLTSKYVGVSWHKESKKWVVKIDINKKSKYVGLFESEIDAAKAYKNELAKINNSEHGVVIDFPSAETISHK